MNNRKQLESSNKLIAQMLGNEADAHTHQFFTVELKSRLVGMPDELNNTIKQVFANYSSVLENKKFTEYRRKPVFNARIEFTVPNENARFLFDQLITTIFTKASEKISFRDPASGLQPGDRNISVSIRYATNNSGTAQNNASINIHSSERYGSYCIAQINDALERVIAEKSKKTFVSGIFDKHPRQETNKSSLTTFSEEELFDKNIVKQVFKML